MFQLLLKKIRTPSSHSKTQDSIYIISQFLTSFSGLTSPTVSNPLSLSNYGYDYDEISAHPDKTGLRGFDRFSLPKGVKTGTLLHSIFEEIDFSNQESIEPVVAKMIALYDFDERWKPVVLQLVLYSLHKKLKDGTSLSQISQENRLVEMEFHFPVHDINIEGLLNIIRTDIVHTANETMYGFMKGFIDLVFRQGEKYFILDYKSNFLGRSFSDYSVGVLEREIIHSNYDLQYHIYSVALHRLLSQSLPGYSYNKYFGGVYYLFLRGINPETEDGVFYVKPGESTITELDHFLKKGENGEGI